MIHKKEITYEEFKKNNFTFPQLESLKINDSTQYIITNCPAEKAGEMIAMGFKVQLPKETITITFYPKKNYTISGNTNLPMSWCVKNDGSKRFCYLVIYFLHEKYGCYSFKNLIPGAYYGIKKDRSNGASESPEVFDVILTLDEFEKMIKKK